MLAESTCGKNGENDCERCKAKKNGSLNRSGGNGGTRSTGPAVFCSQKVHPLISFDGSFEFIEVRQGRTLRIYRSHSTACQNQTTESQNKPFGCHEPRGGESSGLAIQDESTANPHDVPVPDCTSSSKTNLNKTEISLETINSLSPTDKSVDSDLVGKNDTKESSITKESSTAQSDPEGSYLEFCTTKESSTAQSDAKESFKESSTTKESSTAQSDAKESYIESSTLKESSTAQSDAKESYIESSTTKESFTGQSDAKESYIESSTAKESSTAQSDAKESYIESSTLKEFSTAQSDAKESYIESSALKESSAAQPDLKESYQKRSTTASSIRFHLQVAPINSCNNTGPTENQPKESVVGDTTMFLVHGVGGSVDIWNLQINYFEKLNYEIVAMDFIGHGLSCSPHEPRAYLFKEISEDILAVFDRFHKTKNIVVGHSYGCCFSTLLARYRSRFITKLVLISGGSPLPLSPDLDFRCLPLCLLSCCQRTLRNAFLKRSFFSLENTDPAHNAAFNIPSHVLKYIMNGQDWLEGNIEFHSWITIPTLLIHGKQDRLVSAKEVYLMNQTIPGSQLLVVEEAGHMVMIERSEKVNQMIHDFLLTSILHDED